MLPKANKEYTKVKAMLILMVQELRIIYKNKSSDEYKHMGDITKSTEYKRIEDRIADLHSLKGLNKEHIAEIKTLFTTLHRPIFKKMVVEYIHEPNDQNIFYTAIYTVGYRVLVGELSRIFASTIVDYHKGVFVYKPGKISRQESMDKFIKMFNIELDKSIDEFVKVQKQPNITQESTTGDLAGVAVDTAKDAFKGFKNTLFRTAVGIVTGRFNPISFAGTVMSKIFDMKVAKFEEVSNYYEEAKEALAQYQRLPSHKRDEKIIENYKKLIDKYNVKMQNLKAKIDHYDQRANADAEEKLAYKERAVSKEKQDTSKPTTPTGNNDSQKNDDHDDDVDF